MLLWSVRDLLILGMGEQCRLKEFSTTLWSLRGTRVQELGGGYLDPLPLLLSAAAESQTKTEGVDLVGIVKALDELANVGPPIHQYI